MLLVTVINVYFLLLTIKKLKPKHSKRYKNKERNTQPAVKTNDIILISDSDIKTSTKILNYKWYFHFSYLLLIKS